MMTRIFSLVVLVLVLVIVTACDMSESSTPVAYHCDTEHEYSVTKVEENQYQLRLEAGRPHGFLGCDQPFRRRATTSLSRRVSSLEEALRLVDEYRKKNVSSEKAPVAAPKPQAKVPPVAKPVELKVCVPCAAVGK